MTDPDLHAAPVRPEDAAEAHAFLAGLFAETTAAEAWWRKRLDEGPETLALVRDRAAPGAPVAGLGALEDRAMIRLDGRMCVFARPPGAAPALDAALNRGIEAIARPLGVGLLAATVDAPEDPAAAPLCPAGFAPYQRLLVVSLPLDQPASAPPEGVSVAPHAGGDPEAEAEAAAIAWRMLRRERVWPELDGPALAEQMARPESLWLLAREGATGRVVGVAETLPASGFYSMMAIARSHWGTGLADHMTRAGLRGMAERGAAFAFSLVRPENAASLKLQARSGAAPLRALQMCTREVPARA
ncbi:GNAT family N-acetyltransferase [Albimonas pacifica]|uniref:Acetyltransferase (GNAT) family protein n=1 Tax=Albimonas pacifica TaxID=1114924 RepID=A0A1I3BEP8_9RHOB|nr:GNAT family N-acetyltransferase [Albimonas pacifica]SFH60429.1 Acetyltransferase (GNAT) family protein [Albimonas pacifica]